jgi:polygalacturonase
MIDPKSPRLVFASAVMAAALLALCRAGIAQQAPDVPPPSIPQRTFSITDYGAVADGATLNTSAISKAIAACESAGGGTVNVPAGRFRTAAFSLGNNLNLHLDQGATLLLSNKFSDYKLDPGGRYPNLIVAENCHDVAITGSGTIDGQGQPWWTAFRQSQRGELDLPHRPFMVVLRNCTRVLVQGVTLTDSPSFHLVPQACTDVMIDHVQIIAPANAPNTDGCDPSGKNFVFTHCTFDVGDDCIALKPGSQPGRGKIACENFFISNCVFRHGHGMSIGGQSAGGLRHLVVTDCTFDSTNAGIRMKANRGVGGLVEDCTFENITMTNVRYPVYITSYYPEHGIPRAAADDPAQPVNETTPIWRDIHIRNMTSTDSPTAGRIIGLAEMPVSDVQFDHVTIDAQKGLDLWNVKSIHFVDSKITTAAGPALDLQRAADVAGIDPVSGRSN